MLYALFQTKSFKLKFQLKHVTICKLQTKHNAAMTSKKFLSFHHFGIPKSIICYLTSQVIPVVIFKQEVGELSGAQY